MKNAAAENSPIKGEFTAEDVAGLIVFLASDMSRAITGETILVDNGFHTLGAI
jgi:enoyl-[acyl-carrier protein] reductase I